MLWIMPNLRINLTLSFNQARTLRNLPVTKLESALKVSLLVNGNQSMLKNASLNARMTRIVSTSRFMKTLVCVLGLPTVWYSKKIHVATAILDRAFAKVFENVNVTDMLRDYLLHSIICKMCYAESKF